VTGDAADLRTDLVCLTRAPPARDARGMNRFNWVLAGVTFFPALGCSSSSSDGGSAAGGGSESGSDHGKGGNGGGAGAQPVGGGVSGAGGTSGGGSGAGGTSVGGNLGSLPALDPSADVRTLSAGDKGVLCDWLNETLGGYGLVTTCAPGMTVSNNPNQSVCVATSLGFQCKVTVQDVETCLLAQAPSHGCDRETSSCHQLNCQ
jgi:hypothetical protein